MQRILMVVTSVFRGLVDGSIDESAVKVGHRTELYAASIKITPAQAQCALNMPLIFSFLQHPLTTGHSLRHLLDGKLPELQPSRLSPSCRIHRVEHDSLGGHA